MFSQASVIIVEQDAELRRGILRALAGCGARLIELAGVEQLAQRLDSARRCVVIAQCRAGAPGGLDLLAELKRMDPLLPVILTGRRADVHAAVEAMRNGAWDYLGSPFGDEQVLRSVHAALLARCAYLDALDLEREPRRIEAAIQKTVRIVVGDQVYIDRTELPPALITQFIRLAAFQNPEFYRAQAMRLPTFGKPRIVSCAELYPRHVALPRGCLEEVIDLAKSHGAVTELEDRRESGTPLPAGVVFQGELQRPQSRAFEALVAHDAGVLAATTAFGKTVVAAALIAHRSRNTLILVHRSELLKQWVERLRTFLNIGRNQIGVIGGGKRKPTGIIDVALIQSLVRNGEVADTVADYGHLIVDECHHLSAASFELVARRSKARYVVGLSATVARKDGHHPIIFMQCGPVRHRVDARVQAAEGGIRHRVRDRSTTFELPPSLASVERPSIPAIYAALAQDGSRNDLIFGDVLKSLEAKRSPVVLTERKDHLDRLRQRFSPFVKNLVVLRGGMSAGDRKMAEAAMRVPDDQERLILATGRYIGEGFDDARLDTLFLTMPIAWKGTLAQYVGRLHRQHAGKRDVLVVDYVDHAVPVLARMAVKRRAGYRALGYIIE